MANFLFGALLLAAAYGIWAYNHIVSLRNMLREAWSGIDVQLKRRHDLIPNLVELVKAYAAHESETLEEVTRLRRESQKQQDPSKIGQLEKDISRDMQRLIALVENYPDLKADKNFRQLQSDLVEVEDHLQYARRYYNGSVRNFNTAIESFPNNILAGWFSFKPQAFFEIEYATERKTPDVSFS